MLTIFTPTYNRAYILPRLYQSLCSQSEKNFEWLVIDDGSIDNTSEFIAKIKLENKIKIKYFIQVNGGKHRAFNKAIQESQSDWFVCIDSDDYLVPNAVEKINRLTESISLTSLSGVVGVCVSIEGHQLGKVPNFEIISDTIEIRDKYKIWGEPEVYKTSLLKQHRFPEFEGEKFITEAIIFDKITTSQKLLYTNEVLMVKEYLIDGLTNNQLRIRIDCPHGTLTYYKQRFKLSKLYIAKLKALCNYSRFYIHNIFSNSIKYKENNKILLVLSLFMFPPAFFLYLKDRYMLRIQKIA